MKHSERPVKLWELTKGQWNTYDDEYVCVMWNCEVEAAANVSEPLRRRYIARRASAGYV